MATRKASRSTGVTIAFESLSIEGGLLSPEWLSRVAQREAPAQAEADYRVPKGLGLRDEIGRFWRIAQAHHRELALARAAGARSKERAERFVTGLLAESLGFASLAPASPVEIGGRSYPVGFAALGGRVPVVVGPDGGGLDTLDPAFGDGTRRRSPFGLAQEFLNVEEGALWGVASDGATLRILRDNASLTRPSWIEADLDRIFAEERYADFAVLWLLAHETRFGRPGQPARECPLEVWREAGREEGTRAREHLRGGVEEALLALGQGFLQHPANGALRAALQGGALSKRDYFQELLRVAYRLIFLLTVEERGLLHPDGASGEARKLYAEGYGLRRLAERSLRRSAHDRFADLWDGLTVVFRGLAAGEPRLGLPALAGLFAPGQCPNLDVARLENRHLLQAVFRLAWLRESTGLSRVNWRDMGPEELGSVYESLLELVPQVTEEARAFSFATGAETKGNARKTSGSYYTPDSLVQVLLDSALDPVVEATLAAHAGEPPAAQAEALLGLSVVDPACGSGHFLLAAARRLAAQLARLAAGGTPSAADYRRALRQVVSRSIYGVDLNPMAVELCKVSLWMEALEPGLPLTFLDSHVQHGNALLGTNPALMEKGIPDVAWDPIEGDDRKVASALKKRNKAAAEGQRSLETLWTNAGEAETAELTSAVAALDAAPDADAEGLKAKETRWEEIRASKAYRHQRFVADAWCAAFVWPKQPGPLAEAAPTNELWRQVRDGQGEPPVLTVKTTVELAERYRFLHWHLAFPQVFAKGGFDVVLGNPPWERVKLQEQEFFASRDEEIAKAANAAARKKLIAELPKADPTMWAAWCAASREAEGQSQFVRQSGRYPLCGKGDVNTYALFAEHNWNVLGDQGRAGFIVPSGIATDDTTKDYFQAIVNRQSLSSLSHFENEDRVFPGVHHAFRFVLLTLDGSGNSTLAELVFYARRIADLSDDDRRVHLTSSDFETLNPNTRTCPTFRSRRDAEINLQMYRRAGVLLREDKPEGNPWGITVHTRLWHMAEDSEWFRSRADLEATGFRLMGNQLVDGHVVYMPLFEAKMAHHFDHRAGTYDGQTEAQENQGKLPELDDDSHENPSTLVLPYYWVPEAEVEARLRDLWSRRWLLGWRGICRSTDQRTAIISLVPRSAVGDTLPLFFPKQEAALVGALYSNCCAFALDYAARQKVGGISLKLFIMRQLPILAPGVYASPVPWSPTFSLVSWLLPRVLELTYTAWDLEPFARDVGWDGPPFRWDPARRFLLRAELDAAFFHLYGISHDDTEYILDTFPIVRKNDEKAHGEYRTKRVILEVYDAMAVAMRTGQPYQTRLDPPPADPRVAHPDTRRGPS